jgi:hypothetical protein
MSEPNSQFEYCGGSDANCFVPVCAFVTSKIITNVYWEGQEVSGDGR